MLNLTPRLCFGISLMVIAACGGGAQAELPPSPPAPATGAPELKMPIALSEGHDAAAPNVVSVQVPAPTLRVGEASAAPAVAPTTRFVAPTALQVIPADKAQALVVKIDVKNWVTQTGASHVHLILDNRPYKALFDLKTQVTLGELAGGALAEGEHTLVMFPSRMNHESVKSKGALSTVSFFVGKKGPSSFDAKKGSLVFSRPKGEYKGEASNHILVDFQLLNVELGANKHSVRVTVEGAAMTGVLSQTVSSFGAPLFLDSLPSGKYSIKLELLDSKGQNVPGGWNSTQREFVVNREASAEGSVPGFVKPELVTPVGKPMPPVPPRPPVLEAHPAGMMH